MGIEAERFVEALTPDANCSICNQIFHEPIELIECGHYFCNACWVKWSASNTSCAYCGIEVTAKRTRKANLIWNLIQSCNVNCRYKKEGCDLVLRYEFAHAHEDKCVYRERRELTSQKCPNCGQQLHSKHNCVGDLSIKLKEIFTKLANCEHENDRLTYKLANKEKECAEKLSEIQCQTFEESMKYNNEIRELKVRLATLQEIGTNPQTYTQEFRLNLLRVNGSLGFNIIGGLCQDSKSSSGIFVSRIVSGGAADKPGKLQLHDCILEVDNVSLSNATHEKAVEAFRNSGDPVRMLVKRLSRHKTTADATTQTFGAMFVVTGEKEGNKNELYDSAYDTLLTQKSSRSSRMSTDSDSPVAPDVCAQEVKMREKKETNTANRLSTFYITQSSTEDLSVKPWVHDTESDPGNKFDYEYEQVTLEKRNGKFGLLLCVGGDDQDVAVYVGDLEEDSPAEHDGNVLVGDQIVQINGCHVNSVQHANVLLQKHDVISMVVARAIYEEQRDMTEEETDLDMLDSINEGVESQFTQSFKKDDAFYNKNKSNTVETTHSRSVSVSNDDPTENEPQKNNEKSKSSLKTFVRNKFGGSDKKRSSSQSDESNEKLPRCDSNSSTNSNRSSNKSQVGDGSEISQQPKQLSRMKSYLDSPSVARHRVNQFPSPNLRSAIKDPQAPSKSSKHVRIDSHPGWNQTEKRVWEEFKIIQSMEANEAPNPSKVEAEWRVRRSKDGKHVYIKKTNAHRTKALKERECQINDQRCGMTTDDDTFTIYQGQYWNKGQRKRQLTRHYDKRQRLLEKVAQKATPYVDTPEHRMAEIVQRKMCLPTTVFDNFVTVEEILSQRNRSGQLTGPIHVTTI